MNSNPRSIFAKKNIIYMFVGFLLLLLILAYPIRGFVRNTILPFAATVMYTPGLSKTTGDVAKELQEAYPFGQIKYISSTASCRLSDGHFLKTEIFCSKNLFRGQVSIKDVDVDDFENKANVFERSLEAKGWTARGGYDGQVNRTYDPPYDWWYLAQYSKTVGKVKCDLSVERDNDPDLLNAYMLCHRTVVFF